LLEYSFGVFGVIVDIFHCLALVSTLEGSKWMSNNYLRVSGWEYIEAFLLRAWVRVRVRV